MHVLTKIFIVLVSLLAVAIVPLVAVHATNEGTFKKKWLIEQSNAAAASTSLAAQQAGHAAAEQALQQTISSLQAEIAQLKGDAAKKDAIARKLESEIASAKAMQASINSNIEILAQTGKAGAALNESLVKELRDLRSEVVLTKRENVELDEAVSNLQAQLEVADAARKALQEELQRLGEEKNTAIASVAKYVAYFGELPAARAGVTASEGGRVPADRDLSATIINVTRSNDTTLAEINAGSRDGVKEGWVMMIGDNGKFIGNLRIIEVDVNRATGVVELESASRGTAAVGQKSIARKGE